MTTDGLLEHDPTALRQQVAAALGTLAIDLLKHGAGDILQLMRQHDLSMPRVATIMLVARRGCVSISDISEHLNLALGTTSHIVDQLVDAAFVERHENPQDRRLKHITMAERGRQFVQEYHQVRVAEFARRIESVPTPLLARLLEDIDALMAHLGISGAPRGSCV